MSPRQTTARKANAASLATAVAGGGTWALSRLLVNRAVSLDKAIDADQREFDSADAGRLSYYVAGDNGATASSRPLLLIHSINAAPSSHEMRPLFDHYRHLRPVYALDLPGFGFSERSERAYSPALYVAAIVDTLRHIGAESADVIALSLGCEFAATAALQEPTLFRSLTLISPSGLRNYASRPPSDKLYGAFSFPLWSQSFFDLLTSRRSIRFFLGRQFVGEPPHFFLDYAYATAHQPGARWAPLYFLSGQLFNYTVTDDVYKQLRVPTLVIYDRDPNVSFSLLPEVIARNSRWQAVRIGPSLGLPHWELHEQVTGALDTFWTGIGGAG